MANCLNYNCQDEVPDHRPNDCAEEILGGTSGILFLECDHQLTDPSDEAAVQAEIDAGRAKLVLQAIIDMPAPSPVKVDSNMNGCATQKTATYDRTATITDGNVSQDNVEFWDKVFGDQHVFGGAIIYECGSEETSQGAQVTWIDAPLSIDGGRILPGRNNAFQHFSGTINWRKKYMGNIYPAPAGIFE